MITRARSQRTIDATFLIAAARYWVRIFPCACREIRGLEYRASLITDSTLRILALKALREERGNLEGAAAFATLAPRPHQAHVTRAVIAFQAAYDYADAISEQPGSDNPEKTRQLHQALLIALMADRSNVDWGALDDQKDDSGYLRYLADRCRAALQPLPSFSTVTDHAQCAAQRIVTYQVLNHQDLSKFKTKFALWASEETPEGIDLRWWETGAAAGSSLTVFVLMAAAAQPVLSEKDAIALEKAYFPWIGSLHTLLDSLIDEQEDEVTGQNSLSSYYMSYDEAADRLHMLATQASQRANSLADRKHYLILSAMVSFYLSAPQAQDCDARIVARSVLQAFGPQVIPVMHVLRTRRLAGRAVGAMASIARRRSTIPK